MESEHGPTGNGQQASAEELDRRIAALDLAAEFTEQGRSYVELVAGRVVHRQRSEGAAASASDDSPKL